MYTLYRTTTWFKLKNVELRLYNGEDVECIVTEAKAGCSENELVSQYCNNIIGAGGRDRVHRVLKNIDRPTLVLIDLGNINKAYKILAKRCFQNEKLYFYDYQAFEQLLCESDLVKHLGKEANLDIFDCLTIE